jgi:hypothetical protein
MSKQNKPKNIIDFYNNIKDDKKKKLEFFIQTGIITKNGKIRKSK